MENFLQRAGAAGRSLVNLFLLLYSLTVFAYKRGGEVIGFANGFEHPISGLDHILAMVAVGMWGAQLGAPAIWVLPIVFPMVMAFSGMMGLMGIKLPGIELCIALTTSAETGAQESTLMNNAQAFIDAFEKGDAKSVAALWAEDGDYVDLTGRHLQGRPSIENAFKDFFMENKGLKLRIDVNSVRFLTPDMAIEDGTTSVIPPEDAPPSQARNTNVHVKKDGQWVLQSVREAPYTPPGNYEHLRGLEWAIGEWVDEGDGPEVDHVTLEWSPESNFIIST
jgi:uncharacterized protein (TIGR02246 family)